MSARRPRWPWRPADGEAAVPSQCLICHAWPADVVCTACRARFEQPAPRCATCARPVPDGVAQCGQCLREPPPLDLCLTRVAYRWPWTLCVSQFKFYRQPGLGAPLARWMRQHEGIRAAVAQADLVLPLPLSAQRLAERGYNPAQLLAQPLAPERCRIDLLLRIRHTEPQHDLPRAKRLSNVRGAYLVEPRGAAALAGRCVLLVDDVMTTGASLHEAARVVRAAGARRVLAVTFARTPDD